jgi:hypothetical protein
MQSPLVLTGAAALLLGLAAAGADAQPEPAKARPKPAAPQTKTTDRTRLALPGRLAPERVTAAAAKWLREALAGQARSEAAEMLSAIVTGSQMGPGEGWFHAGQSKYSWDWLKQHFDVDQNGKITREEFHGPSDLFDRLDRDHDGVLTSSDFDWSERSLFAMQGMPASQWFRMADTNSNGRLSREEWLALFERASKGKDYLTPDDLREAFPLRPPPRPANAPKDSGPSPALLALGVLTGELGSVFEGPRIGGRAPDFALRTVDGKRQIGLSNFLGKKPIVLIFGSFT